MYVLICCKSWIFNKYSNGIVIVWVLYSTLQEWAKESFSMPGKERNGKSHGAENKRACWCSPEIFSFLQSRGSGGIESGGKELSGEPDKQLNLGTVSSVMETLTQQPERFWAWSLEPNRSPFCVWSNLIVWHIWTLTCWQWICSALFIRSMSKSIFSASVCWNLY